MKSLQNDTDIPGALRFLSFFITATTDRAQYFLPRLSSMVTADQLRDFRRDVKSIWTFWQNIQFKAAKMRRTHSGEVRYTRKLDALLTNGDVFAENSKKFTQSDATARGIIEKNLLVAGEFIWRVQSLIHLLDEIVQDLSSCTNIEEMNFDRSRYSVTLVDVPSTSQQLKNQWGYIMDHWLGDFNTCATTYNEAEGTLKMERTALSMQGSQSGATQDIGTWTFNVSPQSVSMHGLAGSAAGSAMTTEVEENGNTVTLTVYSILPPMPWGSEVYPTSLSTGGLSVSVRGSAKRTMAFSVQAARTSDLAVSFSSVSTDNQLDNLNVDGHSGPMFFPAGETC
jgi:hypothetical protein